MKLIKIKALNKRVKKNRSKLIVGKKLIRFPKQRSCLWFINNRLPFKLNTLFDLVYFSIINKKNSFLIDLKPLKNYVTILLVKLKDMVSGGVSLQYNKDTKIVPNAYFTFLKGNFFNKFKRIVNSFFHDLMTNGSNVVFTYRKHEQIFSDFKKIMFSKYMSSDVHNLKLSAKNKKTKSSIDIFWKQFKRIFEITDIFLDHIHSVNKNFKK